MDLEKIKVAIFEYAEQIAKEYNTSEANVPVEIECEGIPIELTFDIMVSDYTYEEDTNSADYHVDVFCTGYELTDYIEVNTMLIEDIYLETLYKD